MMKKVFLSAVILGLIAFGCAERKVATQPEQPLDQSQAKAGEQARGTEKITEQQVAKVESKDAASRTEEIPGMFKDIYFDYDRYDVREDARPVLKSVADYISKNTGQKVLIEGHCDERGTNEYNLALGDKRAKAAKDYLISLGVPSSRIDTMSYGEEKPVCREQTEECWAKNRRDHFVILKGK